MFDDFTTSYDYYLQFYYDEGYDLDEAERLAAKEVEREERENDKRDGWSNAAWDAVQDAYARGDDPFEGDLDDPFAGEY